MFAVAKGGEELAGIEPKGAGRGAKEIQRKTEIVLIHRIGDTNETIKA